MSDHDEKSAEPVAQAAATEPGAREAGAESAADSPAEAVAEPDSEPAAESAAEQAADEAVDEAALAEAREADSEAAAAATYEAEQGSHSPSAVDEEVYRLKSHRKRQEPAAGSKSSGQRRRRAPRAASPARSEEEAPVVEEDDAARERRELVERIDAALRPGSKRKKRLAGDDLEMLQDDAVAKLRDAMREAALRDVECIRNGEPAVHKMKMLREVEDVLLKRALADSILDGNLLESVRIWLEPLPDASLPSFEIQKALFGALVALPIKTIHLRESGLGRVVLFYQKSKRPQPVVKRMAQKLVGDWTRPIIGRSDNYRDRMVAQADFDPSAAPSSVAKSPKRPLSSYEESAARRNRAALPSAPGISYQVAPVADVASAGGQAVGMGRSQTADSQLRRMKTKLALNRAKARKSQVSVEGKGLNMG